jgi:hypothetical protein
MQGHATRKNFAKKQKFMLMAPQRAKELNSVKADARLRFYVHDAPGASCC